MEHQDAYKSIDESFVLAGAERGLGVDVRCDCAEGVSEANVGHMLDDVAGVLVALGFGSRGINEDAHRSRHRVTGTIMP